jgi:hypothetical protein
MRTVFTIILSLGIGLACLAQASMSNAEVVKMVKAGLSDDIVMGTIKSQPGSYSTTADDLIALKKAGVSDKVIAAMMEKNTAAAASGSAVPAPAGAVAPAATAPAAAAAPMVSEVGVYYMKSGTWADLNPEVVNFKTGGVLKTIGTAGIVKGDVNGHLNGEHSPNQLKTPVELLVYTPDGTAITEYQLLRLRDQKGSREFRTVTGGAMHVSGGATRDLVPFESTKLAPRTYRIPLPNLGSGEYGLLPPAASDATSSSGRIGKIYSFRIVE